MVEHEIGLKSLREAFPDVCFERKEEIGAVDSLV
jgi:hypothetical protein